MAWYALIQFDIVKSEFEIQLLRINPNDRSWKAVARGLQIMNLVVDIQYD